MPTSPLFRMLEVQGQPEANALPHEKSSFVRFTHLFSSNSVLASPPRPHLRSSALEQERNMAYVREKEEDYS